MSIKVRMVSRQLNMNIELRGNLKARNRNLYGRIMFGKLNDIGFMHSPRECL